MRHIQSADAKARLPQILDEVERGESVVITRHGRPVARIIPEKSRRMQDIDAARAVIEELRKSTKGSLSLDDILSARHEGHRY